MISGLFIYDPKGEVLMSKLYRPEIKRNVADVFRIQVISATRPLDIRSPVLTLGSTSFVYIRSGSLWICAVCRSNQDCSVVLEFLFKLEGLLGALVGAEYLQISSDGISKGINNGQWNLNDTMILENFTVIYDILDEIIEFGFPVTLDSNDIKSLSGGPILLTQNNNSGSGLSSLLVGNGLGVLGDRRKPSIFGQHLPSGTASSLPEPASTTPWRPQGIKYRKNDIHVNVEERLNALVEGKEVLRSYVDGKINIKCHLSGMPECRLGFGDNVIVNSVTDQNAAPGEVFLEESRFHTCVSLKEFDLRRQINFVPPDGEFSLMSYHCGDGVLLPFFVDANVQVHGKRVQFKVRLSLNLPDKMTARDVLLKVTAPPGVLLQVSQVLYGKSKWHPDENQFKWKCNKIQGRQHFDFTAEVDVSNEVLNWQRPPMSLDFNVEMFLLLGLSIKYLKVSEKQNYKVVKWVKYVTQAGSYDIRY